MHDERAAEPPAQVSGGHHITLVERGPFLAPRCSCGWRGPARRSRPLARDEAADHLGNVGDTKPG
ncbi:hypothetical protein GCM10027160_44870 [Streptomyces calidiresistens]|uniref:Uncharacterized protein n=1 Tax=Streptomyces calidiresistens TaxID=1485586 RepID=A0A7W3XZJ2_9ACTN|nr:hypothetical protein [Streptomyces calidiresistens]MBB0233033.1 hypothetical protein [Streptomyces calidiresistens]